MNQRLILLSALLLMILSPLAGQDMGKEELKSAIKKFPDSLEVHKAYIKAVGLENPELVEQYELWVKKYPESSNVPFAIGSALASDYSPKAKPWLLKAVEIDPKMAPAWQILSYDADRWGEFEMSDEYMRKAAEADPDNPDYAFYYANSFAGKDSEKYRRMALEVAHRFPDSERGAQSLYWLAYHVDTPQERAEIYELSLKDFPPDKFRWTSSAMWGYYELALKKFPEKAVEIAKEMQELDPEDEGWPVRLVFAEGIIKARDLLASNKPHVAIDVLSELTPDRYIDASKKLLFMTRSEALAATGNVQAAYDSIINYYSNTPEDEIRAEAIRYGANLGKKAAHVEADIWKALEEQAEPAHEFRLKRYREPGDYAELSDYSGKVLLITYWFPGCGPCRAEFPHFENVLKKFSKDEVAYVGINMAPKQDEYVLPFMEASGYTFDPVLDDPENRGNLTARGAPTNYLIDPQGRIIFSHFRSDEHNERSLELMINALLENKSVN